MNSFDCGVPGVSNGLETGHAGAGRHGGGTAKNGRSGGQNYRGSSQGARKLDRRRGSCGFGVTLFQLGTASCREARAL